MAFRRIAAALLAVAPLLPGCALRSAPTEPNLRFAAHSWREADGLFRGDTHWLGADGAFSIDLGADRTLWLFGDTIIDPTDGASRRSPGATIISNSLGIQRGRDPSAATIEFFWRRNDDGSPQAFFPDEGGVRHWPGHGVRLGDTLLLFFMHVRNSDDGLGFEVVDWSAVAVANPDDDPHAWRITPIDTPNHDTQIIVGSAGVLADGAFLYAYGSREPGDGRIYLVKWPLDDARRAALSHMRWWGGRNVWRSGADGAAHAVPTFEHLGTECTIHRDPATGVVVNLRTRGFGAADLVMRLARSPIAAWTDDILLYSPPERDIPGAMIYQGKAHPHLAGAGLVATYCTNAATLDQLLDDSRLYYPRFVRLTRR